MNTAQRIVSLVDKMRKNSSIFRMWKNIPLAKECIQLLHDLDDPDEDSLGKALACRAIREQLPEYDIPRFVLDIMHFERELLLQANNEGAGDPDALESIDLDIHRLNDYIDIQNIGTTEFIQRYDSHLNFDPVERTPQWEELYYDVEKECDRQLGDTPRGMGFCFAYWSTRRTVLAQHGIQWRSPGEMNPRVMFD